jgi:N-acetylglucosaminyldiphosphoundecaprenol N-acetyl-beta-D-mannosaminyltransferase
MKERIALFGVNIDPVTLEQAARTVLDWSVRPFAQCRFVVTPNVDHLVMLRESGPLRDVYAHAHLVLADGWPVVAASRLLGKPLPERVAGSDLVPRLFELAATPLRVFLLGAMPGVAEKAKRQIEARWANVHVVGTLSPPLGFELDADQCEAILNQIASVKPDVLVVGLGAPKQELWVHRHHQRLHAKVALCVGATIDFLAGEKSRAPVWMRNFGMEWLHRMSTEPKRLARRYTKDARIFPWICWEEWRQISKGA